MTVIWGLLGPGQLPSERRTRTLGVTASIRQFNDLAVPGLGGVWFGKQLMLSTLGVSLAQRATALGMRASNIETANAVEALACSLAIRTPNWSGDPRVRGSTMLPGKADFSFQVVRRRGFYVTQPMRMGTVQALPALGLVSADGGRFNSFTCSQPGQDIIDAVCDGFYPFNRSVPEHLLRWVAGEAGINVTTKPLNDALSPVLQLPQRARELLRERLIQGGPSEGDGDKARRRDVLTWVEALRQAPATAISWSQRPMQITSEQHWADIRAGAFFTLVRDTAIAALDAVEGHLGNDSGGQRLSLDAPLPPVVLSALGVLRRAAERFLQERHNDGEANAFCGDCNSMNAALALQRLVARDGRVLCLKGREVAAGPAFRGSQASPLAATGASEATPGDASAAANGGIGWPPGLSFRVQNLFLLNADLHGELNRWLQASDDRDEDDELENAEGNA